LYHRVAPRLMNNKEVLAAGTLQEEANVIVHTAGDFKWDSDLVSLPSTFSSAKDYLYSSNMTTKLNVAEIFSPVLNGEKNCKKKNQTTTFVVVGSQAGLPTFKEDVEKREGKGAVDDESGYIYAMRSVRDWALSLQLSSSKVVLLEPGLVRTAMAEREFARISGIQWSEVPTPDQYVEGVMEKILK